MKARDETIELLPDPQAPMGGVVVENEIGTAGVGIAQRSSESGEEPLHALDVC